jgi:hydroxyacylglutathione hydrolase
VPQSVRIVTGTWKQNCYVLSVGSDAVVIDPGGEFQQIREHVTAARLRVHAVINTHAHYDHLGAVVPVVEEYGVPFHLHPADEHLLVRANFYRTLFLGVEPIQIPRVDLELRDGMSLPFGELQITVLHTPGHTPGSVCFECAGELFTGDTLMAKHVGRTDLPGGERELLLSSIERLSAQYPPEATIHPGHGRSASLGDVLSLVPVLPELRG